MPNIGDLFVGGIKPIRSLALENSHQLAVGSGSLTYLTVGNYSASGVMILLLDQTASPAAYSATPVTPLWFFRLGANLDSGADFTVPPLEFVNGLWVLLSTVTTTPFSATAAGAVGAFVAGVNQG